MLLPSNGSAEQLLGSDARIHVASQTADMPPSPEPQQAAHGGRTSTCTAAGAQQMHNKKKVGSALEDLSRRIGFRVQSGFSERVIFRELFPRGLTLLDLRDTGIDQLNLSNIAARQELRDMMTGLRLPSLAVDF